MVTQQMITDSMKQQAIARVRIRSEMGAISILEAIAGQMGRLQMLRNWLNIGAIR